MAAPESGEREGVGGSNEQKTVPTNYGLRNLLALETAALVRNETDELEEEGPSLPPSGPAVQCRVI